jgi:hypothetical protein
VGDGWIDLDALEAAMSGGDGLRYLTALFAQLMDHARAATAIDERDRASVQALMVGLTLIVERRVVDIEHKLDRLTTECRDAATVASENWDRWRELNGVEQ